MSRWGPKKYDDARLQWDVTQLDRYMDERVIEENQKRATRAAAGLTGDLLVFARGEKWLYPRKLEAWEVRYLGLVAERNELLRELQASGF